MASDAITRYLAGIHSDALTQIGLLLDNAWIYACLVIALMLLTERRNEKRAKIALAMAIALVLGLAVNIGMAVERPCANGGVFCPALYSFPSMHCTMAFILMVSFLNKKEFPLFMLFALFVAFSRINLGVHVFRDVAGALIIALLAYNLADIAWKRWKHG